MDDLVNGLFIGVVFYFAFMFFGLLFLAICAFWYISIPLFCIYVYFKHFRKERKFGVRVLEP